MDLLETFKSEVFRPVVTLVIPGAVAIGPYIIVTGFYIPRVQVFWDDHPSAFVTIVAIVVIAAGLILEDLGIEIEVLWDRKISKTNSQHIATWKEYLELELKDEIVGERYVQNILTWMKFELAMFLALIFLWAGLLWINCIYHVWPILGFILLSIFILGLAGYLLYSSYHSAKNIADKWKLIIKAVKSRPIQPAAR
jgi:hypothetical protein